jgi:hypothetical protein
MMALISFKSTALALELFRFQFYCSSPRATRLKAL